MTLSLSTAAIAIDVPLPSASETLPGGAPPETTQTQPAPTDTSVLGSRTLRLGSRGNDVRHLQRILRNRGFRITVDGAFGPKTRDAVKALQRRFKMRPTGVVTTTFLKRLGVKIRVAVGGTPPPATTPAPADYPLTGPNAANAKYLKAFPVAGKHTYTNDWGAPRGQGSHQGNDIMAARGIPVRAVANGTIERLTRVESGLGGIYIWLEDASGHDYYYAHLNSISDGLEAGTKVTVGQVIGTVGNTGDARYGATHLHFEIRPSGGSPVNPYNDLLAVDPEPPTR